MAKKAVHLAPDVLVELERWRRGRRCERPVFWPPVLITASEAERITRDRAEMRGWLPYVRQRDDGEWYISESSIPALTLLQERAAAPLEPRPASED